jgi:hypothetical protein
MSSLFSAAFIKADGATEIEWEEGKDRIEDHQKAKGAAMRECLAADRGLPIRRKLYRER